MRQSTLEEIGNWWAIRITTDNMTLERTASIFKDNDKYIISQEGDDDTTRLHHHVVLASDESSEDIKSKIRQVYPEAKGNKCIYVKPSRDKRQLAKYTLKEGNYIYKGFSEQFIKEHFRLAVAKTDLKKEITANEEIYILGIITTEQFVERYIDIKVKHDQPLYTNHIVAYVRKMMVRSGNLKSKNYAKDIIYQIEYRN